MASLSKAINKSFFDSILPEFGKPRTNTPIWNESQKMFICDEYEAASGNRYYKGVRFCQNLAIVEYVGIYHNFTYIDGIELYAFNSERLQLIQKQDFPKEFYNIEFIRDQSTTMLKQYVISMMKVKRVTMNENQVNGYVASLIEGSYKSYLLSDYNTRLTLLLPNLKN